MTHSSEQLVQLAEKLLEKIDADQDLLIKMSGLSTSNNVQDTLLDLAYSTDFLQDFINTKGSSIPSNVKPKGNIFVILSFNEPLLLSIIPIFCALAVGNNVFVKPSSKCRELFEELWSIDDVLVNNLTILDMDVSEMEMHIKNKDAVFFFGSQKHSESIYKICAKHHIEFIPEVEAADTKVVNLEENDPELKQDIENTLENSWSHDGKICQRICGVFVKGDIYDAYVARLKAFVTSHGFIDSKFIPQDNELDNAIMSSEPSSILHKSDSIVVIKPKKDSEFVRNGYFARTLWVLPFSDIDDLIEQLNSRTYFLGLNIKSSDDDFTHTVIRKTRFSRYTLNDSHYKVDKDSGWGGNWPTGSGGYKKWYEAFGNKFIVIDDK